MRVVREVDGGIVRRVVLRGKQPKLSARQQTELRRMRASGDYSITDLPMCPKAAPIMKTRR